MAKKTTTKKKTAATAKPKRKKAAAKKAVVKPVSAQPDDPSFRVYKWDAALRLGLKERREELGLTQRELIKNAVSEQLPKLVATLANECGISVEDRSSEGSVRVPMERATLSALRYASHNATDLPMSLLLTACIRLYCREPVKPKRRRSTKK